MVFARPLLTFIPEEFAIRQRHFTKWILAALPVLAASAARATDFRLDVATDGTTADNTTWFGSSQLPALNFPSVHGHDIEQSNTTHLSAITAAGNTLGDYYNNYNTLFATQTASQAVTTVENYATSHFGANSQNRWLVLNEVDAATWNGTNGDAYRTWLIGTLSGLHSAGYNNIVLYSPRYLASKTYASTWQTLAQYAYIGLETYLDGLTIKNENFSLSKVQAYYQGYYDSWTSTTNGPGLDPSRLFAGEHFSVNLYDPTHYWGANGISGADWQAAIEIRDIAIHNIPFGGFIGYAWARNDQATGNDATDLAAQVSYERAYASTMVLQTEVPTWTGNDANSRWNDYLNWTGGLPSTTNAPYPLLASTNPTLPKQTTANLFNTIHTNTTVTLDGNQSITHLAFDSSFSYTIAPGTGGSPTLTGAGASLAVNSGSHSISAGLIVASDVAANLAGNLTILGTLTNNGFTFTKTGNGTLTISGKQQNSANSAIAMNSGILNLNSDAGSPAAFNLSITASGGTTSFNSLQHLASLSLTGGTVKQQTWDKFISTTALSVSSTSTLDLSGNDLIDNYSGPTPVDAIKASLTSGYNHGSWNGKGIISSAARSFAHSTLGYAEASDELKLSGNMTGLFDGETVDATTLLIRYTWVGDANLDGVVNAADLAQMTPGGNTWWQGDFNYDGVVNDADYALYTEGLTYGQQNIALVPEPGMGLILLLPLLKRRRRRCPF